MLSTILQVILALPKIFQLIKEAFTMIQEMQDAQRLRDAKKANNDGDNIELEKQLGNTSPGAVSGIDGSVVRHKNPN